MKSSVLLGRLAVLFVSGISVVSSQNLELEPFERLPTPVVDPASDDAQLAIKRFSIPAGLQAKLWAAEPMLANPVAFDFDEKGRLFVSETHRYRSSVLDIRSYMSILEDDLALRTIEDRAAMHRRVFGEERTKQLGIEGEVVRLVEDTNGDGVADKSRVFSDGYRDELDGIASGVLARHGQVWFTNIPSLWRLDEQPDGSVKKNELLRGFGVRYNFTGHDFHGLALGHDGKLYYSIGDRGTHVKGKEGQVIDYPDEGAVFRSNLDGTGFELFARGLRNPQELAFDEHGNLFTGDNDSDQGDLERLVYLVEGGDSGWRVGYQHPPRGRGGPWIREGLYKPRFEGRPAYLLPPVCSIEDGPSGLAYYPGTGLTPEYKGHFFITHFKGSIARSGIQTYTLKEDGATFIPTSSQQFIGGVLPTDVTFGPDGAFYLADWVDGWPKSNKGRIYGITPVKPDPEQARISAELAKLLAAGFKQRGDAELIALLSHPDRRARLEAQLELAARGEKSLSRFAKVATEKSSAPLARLHAVWGLTQLGQSNEKAAAKAGGVLRKLLADSDAEVRAQSAKGLGDIKLVAAQADLVKSLEDAASRVQFFAAQSLGKLQGNAATAPLLALLERNANKDEYLRHAAVHALARIGRNATLDATAGSPSDAVRLGVLLVYRKLALPEAARFLDDKNAFIVREAAEAINDANIEGAFARLAGKLASAPASDDALVSRAINANFRLGGADHARALAAYAVNGKATADLRAEALTQLGLWGKVPQRDRIVGIYRPLPPRQPTAAAEALAAVLPQLLGAAPENAQLAAIEAVSSLDLRAASPVLAATVANASAPEKVRAQALRQLDAFDSAEISSSVAAAEKAGNAPALRLVALQIVSRRTPDRALPIVRRLATEGSVAEQRAAFQSLAQLNRPEAPALLVAALDQMAAGKVRPGAQVELIEAVEKSNAPTVKARWQKMQAAWAASGKPLAPYGFALAGGNPGRGAGVFWDNAVLPCTRCHMVNGDGGAAGPDLSTTGKDNSVEYLLEAVIKPSAHIAPGFDIVTITLANGETETGSVASETDAQLVLKRADNSSVNIDKKQVKQRVTAPSSMPEIYGQVLSRQDLRDLIAFLETLKQRDPSTQGFGTSNRAMSKTTQESRPGGHE
jgi:quinoprotein glucose dehydrogenase